MDIYGNSESLTSGGIIEGDLVITNDLTIGESPATSYTMPNAKGGTSEVLTMSGSAAVWQPSGAGGGTLQNSYNLSNNPQISTTLAKPKLTVRQGPTVTGNIFTVETENDPALSVTQTGALTLGVTPNDFTFPIAKGVDDQILKLSGNDLIWETPASGGGDLQAAFNIGSQITADLINTTLELKSNTNADPILEVKDSGDNIVAIINDSGVDANLTVSGEIPTIAELQLGEWDFSDVNPLEVVETSPTEVNFVDTVSNLRIITSKAYIVPENIDVGGHVEFRTRFFNSTADSLIGVVFKSDATIMSGFGTGFGEGESYFVCRRPQSNYVAQAGLKGPNILPEFDTTDGFLFVKITRTTASLWTISYRLSGLLLDQTQIFGLEKSSSFLFFMTGAFELGLVGGIFKEQTFTHVGYNTPTYKYKLTQNATNSLSCNLPNGDPVWSANPNGYTINKPLTVSGSVCTQAALFGYPCCVTCVFYHLVIGKAINNTSPETDISEPSGSSNTFGERNVPIIKPGSTYRIKANGLLSTTATSVLELKVRFGGLAGTIAGETLSVNPMISGLVNRAWSLDICISGDNTAFGQNLTFCRTTGMFFYASQDATTDSVEALTITSGTSSIGINTIGSGDLTLTAEFIGSTAGSSLTVHNLSYEFVGFNVS